MEKRAAEKLHSARGVTRAAAILLALIAVLLVMIAVPVLKFYKARADRVGCIAELKTVRDSLLIELITESKPLETEEVSGVLAVTMPGREQLCPAGGTVFLVDDGHGAYTPVCGLHDTDKALRTRLNASYVKRELEEALHRLRVLDYDLPDTVDVELNGKTLECVPARETPGLNRGTATTLGFDGTVAFFGVDPEDPERLIWFSFADESYCANWREDDGWTGDSYLALLSEDR